MCYCYNNTNACDILLAEHQNMQRAVILESKVGGYGLMFRLEGPDLRCERRRRLRTLQGRVTSRMATVQLAARRGTCQMYVKMCSHEYHKYRDCSDCN